MDKFNKFEKSSIVYLTEEGESMSEANNLKGKCSQIIEHYGAKIASTGPTVEVMHFDGKEISVKTPVALTPETVRECTGKDGEVRALAGWLANGIAAKTNLIEAIRTAPNTKFLAEGEEFSDLVYPEKLEDAKPSVKEFTEEDVMADMAPNERAKLMLAEQKAVSIGKLIHKGNVLHSIFTTVESASSYLTEVAAGTGRKAYPVTVKPLYSGEDLVKFKAVYLEKHDEHRTLEKDVNYHKASIKNKLADLNSEEQSRYSLSVQEYNGKVAEFNSRRKAWMDAKSGHNLQLSATCEARRQQMVKEASKLKIFIPEVLRETKKYVETFSIQ